jgi:hypothetical protein
MPLRLGFDSIESLLKHYIITYHPTTKDVTNIKNRKMGDVKDYNITSNFVSCMCSI